MPRRRAGSRLVRRRRRDWRGRGCGRPLRGCGAGRVYGSRRARRGEEGEVGEAFQETFCLQLAHVERGRIDNCGQFTRRKGAEQGVSATVAAVEKPGGHREAGAHATVAALQLVEPPQLVVEPVGEMRDRSGRAGRGPESGQVQGERAAAQYAASASRRIAGSVSRPVNPGGAADNRHVPCQRREALSIPVRRPATHPPRPDPGRAQSTRRRGPACRSLAGRRVRASRRPAGSVRRSTPFLNRSVQPAPGNGGRRPPDTSRRTHAYGRHALRGGRRVRSGI